MITITCFTPEEARRRLAMFPVRNLDLVLERHPHGPVRQVIAPTRSFITYSVVVGEDPGIVIWQKVVFFQHEWRHRPGGVAFREASHEQDIVAWALITLLEAEPGTVTKH